MTRAAVLPAFNQPLEIRDVTVASPRAGEVKVKLAASGVCHSDLSVQNMTLPLPPPLVLGHEGAGVVAEVGDDVTGLTPGDHVVISWVPHCQQCFFCTRGQGYLCERNASVGTGGLVDGTKRVTDTQGTELGQMAMAGTFAEEAVIPAISAVKIPDDIPLNAAALIGCGVLTGVGAAINTAGVQPGDTVAVVGCGGVGLNVIQGARIAGASEIIAVDMLPNKLELAEKFGATHTVNAGEGDAVQAVQARTGGRGVDASFEVIGLGPTIEQAVNMARRGGQAVLVGVPRLDVMLNMPAGLGLVMSAKTIKGCWYGSANVNQDVPKLLDLYRSGELMLDELISRTIHLDDVNAAFEALEKGEVARSVIDYGS